MQNIASVQSLDQVITPVKQYVMTNAASEDKINAGQASGTNISKLNNTEPNLFKRPTTAGAAANPNHVKPW